MGRMHAPGKGISRSAKPYVKKAPGWLKKNLTANIKKGSDSSNRSAAEEVKRLIVAYARKGMTPSQIGVILRDSRGIAQSKAITGNKVLRILKAKGLAPEIPEDLFHLIKKAVTMRKHLEKNRSDTDSKFRLILVESRIHRLARYYKKNAVLPPTWKYESSTASTLVA